MKRFDKITIIGVGLIGGSIALAIKKRRLAKEVIGVFRRRATSKKALKKKAVDRAVMSVEEGVSDADLIIIASPVSSIPRLAAEAIKYAKEGAIITDAGSTKGWIVSEIEDMLNGCRSVRFVGSHPMAGSEHAGVEFAKSDLFNGSPCIVTRTKDTDKRALKKVVDFWKAIGTRVFVMSPASHDRSVSLISHLPHLAAFSLAGTVPEKELFLAAEGFKDTTRVASSDPELWADIFITNRVELLKSARLFEIHYKKLIKALSANRYSDMVKMLKVAKAKRDKLYYGKKP